jgi:formate hydrogenlyase subunit 3/multisubunit Na+/H+ antiporter MnhD subunit
VPPLVGFAGKWLIYNSLILKGYYIQGLILVNAGIIAFLYCFRLIHSVFLGQLKDEHRWVKEAPFFMLVPQYIIIGAIMMLSTIPNTLLRPIGNILSKIAVLRGTEGIVWDGFRASTSLGYWNPFAIMMITMAVFVITFVWLFITAGRSKKVGQFNIVYAAEVPQRPETTHYAYNFFAAYYKAVGFLTRPLVTTFWTYISGIVHGLADFGRRIYTGNGQTYALHIIIYVVVFYFIALGGLGR